MGAALISPMVLALIGALYNGVGRRRAIGGYAAVMGIAAVFAQLIGGLLLRADLFGLGWRMVFLVNIPIGVLTVLSACRYVPESRAATSARTDIVGLTMLTAGLAAVVLPLVEGQASGWPAWTWATLAAAPVLLAGFLMRQRALQARGQAPLIDPAMLTRRHPGPGLVIQLMFWMGQASFFFVFALYLQTGRGLTPLQAGAVFTLLADPYLLASARAPALTEKYGRRVVAAGALILASGHAAGLIAVEVIGVDGPVMALAPGLLLTGAGMGLGIPAITATVLAGTEPERSGEVSGVLTTAQQLGNALGVAAVTTIFFAVSPHGYGTAYAVCLAVLIGLLVILAIVARALPALHADGAA